jgi:hypothetical protein
MFITKKHIPRRTFLRGVGVTLALPLLDSMLPAQTPLARTAASPRARVSFIFIPHGASMGYWTPEKEGVDFEMTRILEPLQPYRGKLTIVSGTAHHMADAQAGEKGADHAHPAAVFLSGAHPKRTTGQDVRVGTTADQIMARKRRCLLSNWESKTSAPPALAAQDTVARTATRSHGRRPQSLCQWRFALKSYSSDCSATEVLLKKD